MMSRFWMRVSGFTALLIALVSSAKAQEAFIAVDDGVTADCVRSLAGDSIAIRTLRPAYVSARVPLDGNITTASGLEYQRLNHRALALRSARLFVFNACDLSIENAMWRERLSNQGVTLVAIPRGDAGECCSIAKGPIINRSRAVPEALLALLDDQR